MFQNIHLIVNNISIITNFYCKYKSTKKYLHLNNMDRHFNFKPTSLTNPTMLFK